ncbi:Cof-type HAD-IIB family hydrolase [Clostridioides difficile]|uniref:Cof-type HAD-IIB family hydrolase n=1 Tax=Clostridioides difficile TaxID=1496 RepID=UPI0018E95BF0
MKLYKLLILDIDGTLRDEVYGIPESAKHAIRLCQKNHCSVVICTGRSMGTIQDDVLSLGVDGYIAGGGNYIQYHGELLYNQSFNQRLIKEVVCLLKKREVAFSIESQEKVFMNQKAKEIFETMNQLKGTNSCINKQHIQEKITYENNIEEYKSQDIHKICLWSNEKVFDEVKDILQDKMELAQRDISSQYYEIIQKDFHKGKAIKRLQERLGVTQKETICFGDGQNDIFMFQASDVTIAMKNSHQQLKDIATSICEDIFDNEIYKELKRRNII